VRRRELRREVGSLRLGFLEDYVLVYYESINYVVCVFSCNWIKKRRETRVKNVTLKL
jgi:hypothetical protein